MSEQTQENEDRGAWVAPTLAGIGCVGMVIGAWAAWGGPGLLFASGLIALLAALSIDAKSVLERQMNGRD